MSSTSFEPESLSIGKRSYIQLGYRTFCMHQYKQSAYTDVCKMYYANCIYDRLPEDEPPGLKHVEDIKKIRN
jgi:hypothetical protein